jgi:hypothetical protein
MVEDQFYFEDFEAATGWTLTNEFEIGAPLGNGGSTGNPDPASAFEGSNVLGVDLTGTGAAPGDYEKNLTDRECAATSPSIDCSGFTSVNLSFMRWLNVDLSNNDHAYIDVFDGSVWHNIWENSGPVSESSWTSQSFDITNIAAGKSDVKIRFAIGPTNVSKNYSGWNIDNLALTGSFNSPEENSHWTGLQDGNWNNYNNWSGGKVPDTNVNVSIPSFVPGQFVPSGFSEPYNEIKRLIIELGTTITISTGDTLKVINDE